MARAPPLERSVNGAAGARGGAGRHGRPSVRGMAEKLAPSERHRVTDETGRVLYEWDQTLRDVDVYVRLPAGVSAKELAVSIAPQHLRFGLAGNPPYLDVRCRR